MTDLASASQGGEAVSYDDGGAAHAETPPVEAGAERRGNDFGSGRSLDFDVLGDDAVDAAVEAAMAEIEAADGFEDPFLDPYGEGETAEVEHEGRTYRIPKALQPALMARAEHDRRSEELAEGRRSLEAARRALSQDSLAHERFLLAHHRDIARYESLGEQLAGFTDVDWRALHAQDPQRGFELWQAYGALQTEQEGLGANLARAEAHRQALEQQTFNEAVAACHQTLADHIEGWTPQLGFDVGAFGQAAFGFSAEELGQVTDPRMIRVLHAAMLGHQAHERSRAEARTARRIAGGQRTAPAATLRGSSGRFPATADTNDFAAFESLADERMRARR